VVPPRSYQGQLLVIRESVLAGSMMFVAIDLIGGLSQIVQRTTSPSVCIYLLHAKDSFVAEWFLGAKGDD
jgi:hypothetical protein